MGGNDGQEVPYGGLPPRYKFVRELGRGGMGVVICAVDANLGRQVAIKLLPDGTFANDLARKLFRNEARITSPLNHPSIAIVHDFDTYDGTDFLVMEYIEGTSLEQLAKTGPLVEEQVRDIGRQLARALDYAHRERVVHRDLKPANLMLKPDGSLKVLDFGLALRQRRDLQDGHSSKGSDAGRHFVGTTHFASPEQIRGDAVDHRTDLYAFGATLFRLATGQVPFPEDNEHRLVSAILERTPPKARSLAPELSRDLEAMIAKCLAKSPERRFRSAQEILQILDRASAPIAVPPADTRTRWDVGAVLAGGLIAMTLVEWWQSRPGPEAELASPAEVSIQSRPSRATVLLDGEPSGLTTPTTLRFHRAKTVTISLAAPGGLGARQQVVLQPGHKTPLMLDLRMAGGSVE